MITEGRPAPPKRWAHAKNPKHPNYSPINCWPKLTNRDAESILGESGLAGQIKKQLAEHILAAELSHHLKTEAEQGKAGNGNSQRIDHVLISFGSPPARAISPAITSAAL